ncbi:MAG: DotI/IcmL family type IV secretion protein [Deltaproteobacteria bacterium]|nr:DotI/IcmL family type IV secretion protein [Deltaproteobacteria bacterium]
MKESPPEESPPLKTPAGEGLSAENPSEPPPPSSTPRPKGAGLDSCGSREGAEGEKEKTGELKRTRKKSSPPPPAKKEGELGGKFARRLFADAPRKKNPEGETIPRGTIGGGDEFEAPPAASSFRGTTSGRGEGLANSSAAGLGEAEGSAERELPEDEEEDVVPESLSSLFKTANFLLKAVKHVSALLIILSLLTAFGARFAPSPATYAVTEDLRALKIVTTKEPRINRKGLQDWAAATVCSLVSLDFLNWETKLEELRPLFDGKLFDKYVDSLKRGGHLDRIVSERLTIGSVPDDAPVIVSERRVEKTTRWEIQVPMVVSYRASHGVAETQRLLASLTVERRPGGKNPLGLAVTRLAFNSRV